ncbi:MAG: hypothetical protein C4583_10700 [Anaerolineaceae bacterium]|nr:MAG: hypothetical protein C4583_10700 [Anaerolineaceae bacterium]
MKPVIWIDSASYKEAISALEKWATLIHPEDFINQPWQASLEDADAAIATARFCFDTEALQRGSQLKIIARLGVGYDNVDVEEATRLGICVTITPDGSTQSVAEHTIALMMALCRKLREADECVRQGNWNRRQQLLGPDLSSLTLGIVGLGRIGSRVAYIAASGLGMRVLAYDPYLSFDTICNCQAEPCSTLIDLLEQSDVVSLHVPGNDETRHMLCSKTLAHMKTGSKLINTARGMVIAESDLIEVIQSGQLSGAALDVFETEPPQKSSPLMQMPEVILSPHSAGISIDSLYRIGMKAAEQVRQLLSGEQPDNLVNPLVWKDRRR